MDALEYALKKNPAPLQHFSALKDFSGENIAFLTSVSSWKTSLRSENVPATTLNGRQSLSIEPCATNQQDRLREQFNQALRIYTEFISQRDAEFSINISDADDTSDTGSTIGEGAYYWGDIPDGFDETVFDDAETSIKYLVLTNTWPKFVKDRRTSFDSAESNESYDTLIDMVVRRTQVFAKE
ncbi:hypothetical protein HYQ46_006575 [Verticillium longisporum]|nr:hypothetical protein HYQ46_006575 [Verticillium longisporum]